MHAFNPYTSRIVNTPFQSVNERCANCLWRYRTERQLSQQYIARLLGHRTGAQVSRWESGEKVPTLDNALNWPSTPSSNTPMLARARSRR